MRLQRIPFASKDGALSQIHLLPFFQSLKRYAVLACISTCMINFQALGQSLSPSLPGQVSTPMNEADQTLMTPMGRSLTAPGTDSRASSAPNRVELGFSTRLGTSQMRSDNSSLGLVGRGQSKARTGAGGNQAISSTRNRCNLNQVMGSLHARPVDADTKQLLASACGTTLVATMRDLGASAEKNGELFGAKTQSTHTIPHSGPGGRSTRPGARIGVMLPPGVKLSPESVALAKSMLGGNPLSFGSRGAATAGQGWSGGWSSGGSGSAGGQQWKTWKGWGGWEASSTSGGQRPAASGGSPTGLTEREKVGVPATPNNAQQSGLKPSSSEDSEVPPDN
jgi:hypothetical protein